VIKLPSSWVTVTPLSKIVAMIFFILFPFLGFYFGIQYQKLFNSSQARPDKVDFSYNSTCSNLVVPNYDLTAEYYTNLQVSSYQELVRIYLRPSSAFYPTHIPPVIFRLFTHTTNEGCYNETLSSSFPANELQESQLIHGFWGDERDALLFIPESTGYGSGFSSNMQFAVYLEGKYQIITGPLLDDRSSYMFPNSNTKGQEILVMRALWDTNEARFDPHRYQFFKYTWNGKEYIETILGLTKNKYNARIEDVLKAEPNVIYPVK